MLTLITITVMYYDEEDGPGFYIDMDDYSSLMTEESGRSEPGHYDKRAALFLKKALENDDRDGDGVSTLSNCLSYLEKWDGAEGTVTASEILSYVRGLRYMSDQELYRSFDWAAYPVETIVKGGGDCEDLAILTVALLHRAGYPCGILLFQDHAVAVAAIDRDTAGSEVLSPISVEANGITYQCLETTAEFPIGYTFGDYSESDIRAFVLV